MSASTWEDANREQCYDSSAHISSQSLFAVALILVLCLLSVTVRKSSEALPKALLKASTYLVRVTGRA